MIDYNSVISIINSIISVSRSLVIKIIKIRILIDFETYTLFYKVLL